VAADQKERGSICNCQINPRISGHGRAVDLSSLTAFLRGRTIVPLGDPFGISAAFIYGIARNIQTFTPYVRIEGQHRERRSTLSESACDSRTMIHGRTKAETDNLDKHTNKSNVILLVS
jgi:hypothetical protein